MFSFFQADSQIREFAKGKNCKGGRKGGMGGRAILAVFMVLMMLIALPVAAQQPVYLQNSGTSAFLMATGWTEQPFEKFEGGFRAGLILPLDRDRGLSLRTAYQSLNIIGGEDVRSIEVMPTLTWYVGTKWEFYLTGGLTGYVDGDNTGFDGTGGFGVARRFWTQLPGTSVIPASADVFAELSFTDAGGQPTGGLAQLSIGIRFNKAGN